MFGDSCWPGELRRQQKEALEALETRWSSGAARGWVALPPGAGKTLVGLEAARGLNRRTVVFGPNTAIQQQWLATAAAYEREPLTAGSDRILDEPLTVLTYQSLATFDPELEVDDEGRHRTPRSLTDRLHANGRALLTNLRNAGPLTLVLDECHHLLEVWGRLLAELLETLPDAYVIGLTATPPAKLTTDQAELVATLFGAPVYTASIPALVRDGYLAPFSELAWLTTPTAPEAQWLREQATRFAELTSDLDHPDFATVPLWDWLERRFVRRTTESEAAVSWQRLERDHPDLTAAVLRFSYAGKLPLPDGARLREEHRVTPTAEDWVCVIDDYVRGFLAVSRHAGNTTAYDRLRAALPAIGWTLTKKGIQAGRSPIDRVLARSESKTHAAVEIAAAEAANLGARARVLVLTDHTHAAATLPATLVGVIPREAGSASLVLQRMCREPRTAALNPVLVTGTTVSCAPQTAEHLLRHAEAARGHDLTTEPGDFPGTVHVVGRWSPRDWVPLLTSCLTDGHTQLLIGTRALLGEGWDAPCVNVLIDLTTSTTATSVVQTRGRGLRIDPAWPGKVANTWSVACVTDQHPKGSADWSRLVRKHAGFLALDLDGEITDGVTHLDPSFSPYHPPPVSRFDELNAQAITRSEQREDVRSGWAVGTPYSDHVAWQVHVSPDRPSRWLPSARETLIRPRVIPAQSGAVRRGTDLSRPQPWYVGPPAAVLAGTAGLAAQVGSSSMLITLGASAAAAAYVLTHDIDASARAGELLDEARTEPDLVSFGCAVADGLITAGLIEAPGTNASQDSDAGNRVRMTVDHHGVYRVTAPHLTSRDTELFAASLDEVLSPIGSPRYLMPRYLLPHRPEGRWGRWRAGWLWRHGHSPPNAVIYHAVPAALAGNVSQARAFAGAWSRWVSAGSPVYANSPEGAGILATHRGRSPLDVTTALRVSWH